LRLGLPFITVFFDPGLNTANARACLLRHKLGELIKLVVLKLGLSQDRHRIVNPAAP